MMEIIDAYALVFRDLEDAWNWMLDTLGHGDEDEDRQAREYIREIEDALEVLVRHSGIQSRDGLRDWEVK